MPAGVRASAVREVHVVWLTAGLSCDGDTVSVTAAEQPSIEDILLGNIPGIPKVHLHNPDPGAEGQPGHRFFFSEWDLERLP